MFLSARRLLCLTEKTHALEMLCLGVGYSAVGHKFSVNKSTINIKFGV